MRIRFELRASGTHDNIPSPAHPDMKMDVLGADKRTTFYFFVIVFAAHASKILDKSSVFILFKSYEWIFLLSFTKRSRHSVWIF